jgi:hypothetical protein
MFQRCFLLPCSGPRWWSRYVERSHLNTRRPKNLKYDIWIKDSNVLGFVSKSKAVPIHAEVAFGGDRRYSSYSFLTSALEVGEWSASRSGRALPPGKEPPVPTVQEAGWAPEPVWTQRLEGKSSASVRDQTPTVRSVVRHYLKYLAGFHKSLHSYYCSVYRL